jgi:hypothetical protein
MYPFATASSPALDFFTRGKSNGRMKLNTLPYRLPRLRMCGAATPHPICLHGVDWHLTFSKQRVYKIVLLLQRGRRLHMQMFLQLGEDIQTSYCTVLQLRHIKSNVTSIDDGGGIWNPGLQPYSFLYTVGRRIYTYISFSQSILPYPIA